VRLAAQGLRNMDSGEEQIEDDAVLAQVQGQARRVRTQTTIWAVVLTILSLLLPVL
jgi:hypothetical protein